MDNEIYRELASKCELERHIVRIEINNVCGTGFLYIVKNSGYVYIITACHVILEMLVKEGEETVSITYLRKTERYTVSQFEICTLFGKAKYAEKLDAFRDDEYKANHEDIAVLRIKREEFLLGDVEILPIYRLSEEKIKRNMIFAGYGFPNEKMEYVELFGECLGWDEENKLLTCRTHSVQSQSFDEAMRGFSGTGLMVKYEDNSVFGGIVLACDREEMHQQFRVVGSTEISEELKRAGWDVMEEYDDGTPPARFYRGEMIDLQEEYLKNIDKTTRQLICEKIKKIDKECSPPQMIVDEKFYDIPKCYGNRKSCNIYWRGRVWSLLVAGILHDGARNDYYVFKDGKKVSMKYICSEGDGEANIASVIHSACDCSVLGAQIQEGKIPGDCVLIWDSKKNPCVKRYFSTKSVRGIIKNIADGDPKYENLSRDAAYDLLDGEMKEKNYAIVHVQELIDKLDGSQNENEMKKRMEAIFCEVWG